MPFEKQKLKQVLSFCELINEPGYWDQEYSCTYTAKRSVKKIPEIEFMCDCILFHNSFRFLYAIPHCDGPIKRKTYPTTELTAASP